MASTATTALLWPLYTALLVVNLLHFVVACFLFVRWRRRFPICGRKIWLCVSIGVGVCVWTSFEFIKGIAGRAYCAAELVFAVFPLFWLGNAYLVRAWRIWFLFYMACEQLESDLMKSVFRPKSVEDSSASSEDLVKKTVERIELGREPTSLTVGESDDEADGLSKAPRSSRSSAKFSVLTSPSLEHQSQRPSLASSSTRSSVATVINYGQDGTAPSSYTRVNYAPDGSLPSSFTHISNSESSMAQEHEFPCHSRDLTGSRDFSGSRNLSGGSTPRHSRSSKLRQSLTHLSIVEGSPGMEELPRLPVEFVASVTASPRRSRSAKFSPRSSTSRLRIQRASTTSSYTGTPRASVSETARPSIRTQRSLSEASSGPNVRTQRSLSEASSGPSVRTQRSLSEASSGLESTVHEAASEYRRQSHASNASSATSDARDLTSVSGSVGRGAGRHRRLMCRVSAQPSPTHRCTSTSTDDGSEYLRIRKDSIMQANASAGDDFAHRCKELASPSGGAGRSLLRPHSAAEKRHRPRRHGHRRHFRAIQNDTGESTWFADRKHYSSSGNMARLTVGVWLVEIIAATTLFVMETQKDDFVPVALICSSLDNALWVFTGVSGLAIIFALWTAWRLRKIQDGFFIKRELKISAFAGLFSTFAANVFSPAEQHIQLPLFFINGTIFTYAVFTEHVIRVWRDSKRHARRKRHALQRSRAESVCPDGCSPTLSKVFDDPGELQDFTEHLKREFSTENILYYVDTKEFAQRCDEGGFATMEERNYRAAEIYADYITEDSPLQVNLSDTLRMGVFASLNACIQGFAPELFVRLSADDRRGSITATASNVSASVQQTCVQEVSRDVFRESSAAIFKLMEQDSFVRFKEARSRRLQLQAEAQQSVQDIDALPAAPV